MLHSDDLKQIKQVIKEVIKEEVLPHFSDVYGQLQNVDRQFKIIDQRFLNIDGQFEGIGHHFENIEGRFQQMDQRFDKMDQRFDRVEGHLSNIEVNMVTKDYLEDRLGDFKASLKQTGTRALRQVKQMAGDLYKNRMPTADQVVQITTA